jgi:hypothetical protein
VFRNWKVYDGGASAAMGLARNGMFAGAQHSDVAIPCVKKDLDHGRIIKVSVVDVVQIATCSLAPPKSIHTSSTQQRNLNSDNSASVPHLRYGLHWRLQAEGGSLGA